MGHCIGLIYGRDENWIAGSYYIENLIHALKVTPGDKPLLKIYSESIEHFESLKAKTQYPVLQFVELKVKSNWFDRIINKISYFLFKTHWLVRGLDAHVDVVFPASDTFYFDKIRTKLYWIPDFQEKHFPNFFPAEELAKRKKFQRMLVNKHSHIVFSSQNASQDFHELYPNALNKTFVMPFAVTIPDLNGIDMVNLRMKYAIGQDYFICCNQFWAHKNHITVLKAVAQMKKSGLKPFVVFTGKQKDTRNPDFFNELEVFVHENSIDENVRFLGFIDRSEQLVLIQHSIGVIQPSRFEGWSTVVEDAKALNIPILVSDIAVHHEQLGDDGFYFPPQDAGALAIEMKKFISAKPHAKTERYDGNVKTFGSTFLRIIEEVVTPS